MAIPSSAANTIFIYKGVDRKGKNVSGEISSGSVTSAKAQLIKQGIKATSVKKRPKPRGGGQAIKPLDIAFFTRQMATMMKAGVPLVQSFDIVAEGVEKKSLADLIKSIRDEVASGTAFAKALEKHPKYFDDLFCSLVESGEQSGALETMLDRIAIYKEKTERLKAKIKKALTYPIAVVVVAIIVTGVLLVKVVPQFAETFGSFGAKLPAFTLFVLGLSNFAQQYWWVILIALVGCIVSISYLKRTNKRFAHLIDKLMLRIPIVGKIVFESIIARYARTLSTTFAAGVPLIDALESVAGATGNIIYEQASLKVRDDVATGTQLNASMRATRLFPSILLQMTAIGEESGALDEMLDKVATYYEESVDNQVDSLTSLLEPMIMAILGVLVGGLLVAMYLPIFQLGNVV